jgi:hypothetical protein
MVEIDVGKQLYCHSKEEQFVVEPGGLEEEIEATQPHNK